MYRDFLRQDNEEVCFVYLKGDDELIRQRLEERPGHFMKPDLLSSQFAALQEPEKTMTIDISRDPDEIVSSIKKDLRKRGMGRITP